MPVTRPSTPVAYARGSVLRTSARRTIRRLGAALLLALTPWLPLQPASAQEALVPGAGVVTRFSGTIAQTAPDGTRVTVIDPAGITGLALDLSAPGRSPDGSPWRFPPELFRTTAAATGQVFGIALDDAPEPNIYLTATSAFGLHRNSDNSGWMEAMWGEGGGPGTVYRLDARDNYRASVFARITLDGRANSGAALGNITYDRWHRQFFVSDLETGMIHRLRLADGFDAGHYDHGGTGRTDFLDAATGERLALPAIGFDPDSAARVADCPSGDFARDPSCWNVADFRRRVWGLGVRRDAVSGEVRLYYAVWGAQGFGNPDHASAGDDEARNSVWSVALAPDGDFDTAAVRREFMLPDFFRSPEAIARAGFSQPVSDISFADYAGQTVMLLAERGGLRNRGLDAGNSFAFPHESRVLRYRLGDDGQWRPDGRYDVGYQDRREDGPPYIRAGSAGGAAFGMGYRADGSLDEMNPDAFVWMSGDGLCAPAGPCPGSDGEVHGLQGNALALSAETEPVAAFQPYPVPGPATPPAGPDAAFMVDTDLGAGAGNDATRIGDIAIYQQVPVVAEIPAEGPWYGPWPGDWPWPVPVPGGDVPGDTPPPGEELPELAITKVTPPFCDWERECTFLLTVTNNGPGVYEGPLMVVDFAERGVESAASPGWTCEQVAVPGPVICRHEPLTLAPGDVVFLALTMEMPAPDPVPPAWDTELTNCGFILWAGSMTDAGRIQAVEAALRLAGYDPGLVDGIADIDTQAAIDAYRADHGLPPGGMDDELYAHLYPGSAGLAGDADESNDFACAPYFLPGEEGHPPPPPLEAADLALEKVLLSEACVPGATCDFRIMISNVGGEAFHGPLVFGDIAGIAGVGPFPPDAVVPASPGLVCVPEAGGQRCGLDGAPVLDLAPGAVADFEVRITVPAEAPPMSDLRNCGVIHWGAMGVPADGNPGNDFHCVDVPLPVEAVPVGNVDLAVEKMLMSGDCAPGTECGFRVIVRNVGDTDYEGRLVVSDVASSGGGPAPLPAILTPGIGCALVGPPPTLNCLMSDAAFLPAGGAPGHIDILVDVPAGATGPEFENCASLHWSSMDFPGGRDANDANDTACVTLPIGAEAEEPTGPDPMLIDLAITKQGPETCMQGVACPYTITVTNNGPEDYNGSLWVLDQWVDGPIDDLETAPASWGCDDSNYRGINCRHDPLVLAAGDSVTLSLTWPVPADRELGNARNCGYIWFLADPAVDEIRFVRDIQTALDIAGFTDATRSGEVDEATQDAIAAYRDAHGLTPGRTIDDELIAALFPGSAALLHDSDNSNDSACVDVEIIEAGPVDWGPAADLGPGGDTECVRGETCALDVRIDNHGDLPFAGAAGIRGTLAPAVTINRIESHTDGLICAVTGPGAYECLGASLSIKPGDAARFDLYASVPADFASDTITHTKDMVWPDASVKDRNPDNDRHVSTIDIVDPAAPPPPPLPDLAISKVANQSSCTSGERCRFAVNVTNNGPGAFDGTIELKDVVSPGTARLVEHGPQPWACRGARGSYSCRLSGVSLAPGASRALSMTFATSRNSSGSLRNCASLDWDGRTQVARIQQALSDAGFKPGPVDGVIGALTRAAIRAYREANGLPASTAIDAVLLQALLGVASQGDSRPGNDQACAEVRLVAPPPPQPVEPAQPQAGQPERSVQPAEPRATPPATTPPAAQPPAAARPACPSGWKQVGAAQAAILAAQGRRVMPVTKGGRTILCVAPAQRVTPQQTPQQTPQSTAPRCEAGWTTVSRTRAKALVQQGYEIKQIRSGGKSILCARPRQ